MRDSWELLGRSEECEILGNSWEGPKCNRRASVTLGWSLVSYEVLKAKSNSPCLALLLPVFPEF